MMYLLQVAIYVGTVWFLTQMGEMRSYFAASCLGAAAAWIVTNVIVEIARLIKTGSLYINPARPAKRRPTGSPESTD